MGFTDVVTLARIILGFLTVQPMSGYDLIRAFRTSAAYFWNADKAQIYRTLSRLVEAGHARKEIVPGRDAPDRAVHHITDAGRHALTEWLQSDPAEQPERDAFIARIFFAGSLEVEALQGVIGLRLEAARSSLGELRALRSSVPSPDPGHDRAGWLRSMTLDHGIRTNETHIDWLEQLLAGLGGERS
ncbi:PadR family transcriptional regulator [Microbacterium sp.]|uniref:PadR family transcriptional regulator n=1 Tax=Microbacterium sp. TaxID=51671 RepID=UPI0028126A19|nr:PadR family transcriptional regulator [Microbacterium sp.]